MLHLDLTDAETKILHDVLECELSDLRMEISHTDRLDFRDMLRQRALVLRKLLGACEEEPAQV